MLESDNQRDSVYYFSAVFGAAQRIFNIEYLPDMMRLFIISNWVHSALSTRLANIDALGVEIPPELTNDLARLVGDLANHIERDEDYSDLLDSMGRIGYAMTGNGYYLMQAGRI